MPNVEHLPLTCTVQYFAGYRYCESHSAHTAIVQETVRNSGNTQCAVMRTTFMCVCVFDSFSSVHYRLKSDWVVWGRLGSGDPLPVFSPSAGGHCGQSWHGHGCPLSDVVHPALLPTTELPTFQGALNNVLGEASVSRYVFPSLERCQKRFLWAHRKADLTPHPVVGHSLLIIKTIFF